MEYFALFKITIKKNIPINEAMDLANSVIQSAKMKETKKLYTFQNIPKSRFIKDSILKAKQSKNITYFIGHLKPKYIHLHGAGLTDFLKKGIKKLLISLVLGKILITKHKEI